MSRLVTGDRPRGCSDTSEISRSATGDTLPPSSASTSSCLCSADTTDSLSAARSSGWVATTRPNRNRSSSRSSSWPRSSAAKANASTASCSSASVMSAELAQRARTAAATSASAASLTLPCSRSTAIAPFSSAGRMGRPAPPQRVLPVQQVQRPRTGRRRQLPPGPPVGRGAGRGAAGPLRGRRRAAGRPGSGPRAAAPSARQRRPGSHRASLLAARPISPRCSSSSRNRSTTRLCRASSVSDSPTICRPGRWPGPRPQLRSAMSACWRSALKLCVGGLGEPPGLGLGLLAHLGDDLGALLAWLPRACARPRAGLGQLLPVLLQHLLRLGLSVLGPLQTALDLVGPLGQHLLDPRQRNRPGSRRR